MKYVSGKYVQGELLENIREIEDWITDYYVHYGAVSDGVLQNDMDRRVRDASFGRNAVFFDDLNFPSIMVRFPFTKLKEIDSSWANSPHQSFIKNGAVKNEFWVGKYLPIVNGSGESARAVSLRRRDPANNINFDNSRLACTQKGTGWHLMTNAEWALILLLAHKNQFFTRGNNSYGKNYVKTGETAEATYMSGGTVYRTATGTGPVAWSHDGTPFGVFDLNGNVNKWVAGLRLNDGEIQIFENNNAADGTKDHSVSSDQWKAILQDGSLVAPGTEGTLKMDATNVDGSGNIVIGTTVDNVSDGTTYATTAFKNIAAKGETTIPAILKQLGLFPQSANYPHGTGYMRNLSERLPSRGGDYSSTSAAGLPYLNLLYGRARVSTSLGFSLAWQP